MITITRRQARHLRAVLRRAFGSFRGPGPALDFTADVEGLHVRDARIFETSTVSKERLCDLHEYVELKMPSKGFEVARAYLAVRSGIFEHAVRILEGKVGASRSMDAAKQWIDSLDLLTMDVLQLHGIGPTYESEWKSLLADSAYQPLLRSKGTADG